MKIITKIVLCLSFVGLSVSCRTVEDKPKQTQRVQVVQAMKVGEQPGKEFSFISKPFRASDLSFRVSGPIQRFEVYTGNYYRQGEVIAEIDPRDFYLRKEKAEAVYIQAKAEYERIEVLYGKNNVSASTYEKIKAEYTSAKVAFETAVNEWKDTRLVAPFDGYVGEVYMEKFQEVKATQPVVSFIDIGQLKIEAYVTQDVIAGAGDLKKVNLQFDTGSDKVYEAQVLEISKNTMSNNLSYLLTAIFPNREEQLPAGMSGKLLLEFSVPASAACVGVPQQALCHQPILGDYVWVVDSRTGKVSRRGVKISRLLPDARVALESGLSENERVAISGLRFLSDGDTIMPLYIK